MKRPGYIPLNQSIKVAHNGHSAEWFSTAPHAMFVEEGTGAHIIRGKLKFVWKGGKFYWKDYRFGPTDGGPPSSQTLASGPGAHGYKNWNSGGAWVFHPGTDAQPFLMPAYKAMVPRQMMEIAKREFPG